MARRKYGRFGGYLSPVVVMGTFVPCDERGVVKVVGMSAGPLAWPIGEKDGQRALVVFKGLARALQTEPAEMVAVWWGLDVDAVCRWQRGERGPLVAPRAIAPAETAAEEDDWENRRKAWQVDDDHKRLAEPSQVGRVEPSAQPAPWHSPAVDVDGPPAAISRKRRWEPWEDDLVRTCSVQEVVRKTRRKAAAVWARRYRLGVTEVRGINEPEAAAAAALT